MVWHGSKVDTFTPAKIGPIWYSTIQFGPNFDLQAITPRFQDRLLSLGGHNHFVLVQHHVRWMLHAFLGNGWKILEKPFQTSGDVLQIQNSWDRGSAQQLLCAKKWTPLTCGLGCLLCFFPALQTWNSWSLLLAFLVLYNSFHERFFGEAVCPVSNSLWVAVGRYKTPSEKQGCYSLKDVDLLLKCNPSSNNRSFLRRKKAV